MRRTSAGLKMTETIYGVFWCDNMWWRIIISAQSMDALLFSIIIIYDKVIYLSLETVY